MLGCFGGGASEVMVYHSVISLVSGVGGELGVGRVWIMDVVVASVGGKAIS